MAVDRRLRWLGAVLIVAVIAVMVARSGNDAPAPAAVRRNAEVTARPTSAAQRAAQAAENAAPVTVRLQALNAARETPVGGNRDPFRFQQKPEPPVAPPAKRIPGMADDQVGAPPPSRLPTGPPPPPPIALKFIGLVQKTDGTKIAVLSDGKRPIHGTEGEEIEGRYKILKIGTESIEIAYIDGRGRQTIRLTGQ